MLPGIQTAAADVAAAQGALFETVKQSPSLFVKPKTMVIYGVRVGFKKEKGKVSISNEEITIRLIRKHLPDQAESLIQTTDKVLKNALQQLSGAELKKIGAEIQADTDQVFIKPVGDDIDKFVAALLEEGEAILKEAV
ncbi:MAG: hypothetical protein C0622_05190 [Desulfuromonas sp.]|nr:MAG: hypothetical protein C0622_05190 [Desulfuromonas sp.]